MLGSPNDGARVLRVSETLGAQLLAGVFVAGSYYAAQYLRVRRPRARGERIAVHAKAAPSAPGLAADTA